MQSSTYVSRLLFHGFKLFSQSALAHSQNCGLVLDAICIYTQLNNCLAMKLNIAKARNRSGVPHHVIKEVAGWRVRFGFPTLLHYVIVTLAHRQHH